MAALVVAGLVAVYLAACSIEVEAAAEYSMPVVNVADAAMALAAATLEAVRSTGRVVAAVERPQAENNMKA